MMSDPDTRSPLQEWHIRALCFIGGALSVSVGFVIGYFVWG